MTHLLYTNALMHKNNIDFEQVSEEITLINPETACIKAAGSYGVVHISTNQQIACATCCYAKTNCEHVQHLLDFVQTTESDLPDGLKMFSLAISSSCIPRVKRCYPDLTCLSSLKIPFILPTELSLMLTMPAVERFGISDADNVAKLVPDTSILCNKCFQISWSEPHYFGSALIVTERQLLPAHSTYFSTHFLYMVRRI